MTLPGVSRHDGQKRAAFPRGMRLLRHADFERVYKQGRRHFSANVTVFYLGRRAPQSTAAGSPAVPGLRVGFTVSRALGGAVQRNRMKRRLREAVRLSHPPSDVEADVVMNPKKSLVMADFQAVLEEVRRAFSVVEQKLRQQPSAAEASSGSRKPRLGIE
jgi:ribonuclease P protein component